MRIHLAASATLLFACSHAAPAPVSRAGPRDWISRSDQNAQLLLDVQRSSLSELAARTGVAGIDDRISDFTLAAPAPAPGRPAGGPPRWRTAEGRERSQRQ